MSRVCGFTPVPLRYMYEAASSIYNYRAITVEYTELIVSQYTLMVPNSLISVVVSDTISLYVA